MATKQTKATAAKTAAAKPAVKKPVPKAGIKQAGTKAAKAAPKGGKGAGGTPPKKAVKTAAKPQAKKAGGTKAAKSSKDIFIDSGLVKQTLMAEAFPSLIKRGILDGVEVFSGMLPGFENAMAEAMDDLDELTELLQEMLDTEVEELILTGKELPYLPDDEELIKKFPGHEVKLLDINVWAYPDDFADTGCGCGCDGHHVHDDGCDCGDPDCNC